SRYLLADSGLAVYFGRKRYRIRATCRAQRAVHCPLLPRLAEEKRPCNAASRRGVRTCAVFELIFRRRARRLAQALDCDELIAWGRAIGHGDPTRDLVAVHLAERSRPNEITRSAVSGGDRNSAGCATGQTAIDAIAIGIIGNDERTPLGLRGSAENDNC